MRDTVVLKDAHDGIGTILWIIGFDHRIALVMVDGNAEFLTKH
jgi:hypothetical protein